MGEVLKFLGPVVGSLLGVTVGMLLTRRKRREEPDYQPARVYQWGFVAVVAVLMGLLGAFGVAECQPRIWAPAFLAIVLVAGLGVAAELKRKKVAQRQDAERIRG